MLDYLIVGQGLAGSVLALQLLEKNKNILVVDELPAVSSSKVAAGVVNPIVFRRMLLSWKTADLLPVARDFYARYEQKLQKSFYHSRTIVKLFTQHEEITNWRIKQQTPEGEYLSDIHETPFDALLYPHLGWAEVKQGANLHVREFIEAATNYLINKNAFHAATFKHTDLIIENDHIAYQSWKAKKIVFCEGYKAIENPLFKGLPFKLTKGETLSVRVPGFRTEKVLNKGAFMLPIANETYKVGATYEWQDLTEHITNKGKEELFAKLQKILQVPIEIIDQEAAIRPTVSDRRPLLGNHPAHAQVYLFNGLGTKGVMLAPYFAQHLYEYMEEGKPLDKEVDIRRFNS